MERDRKGRIIAVTSMLMAVIVLTIAYAVFSKSLNIQNISATVKANEANFSVKFSKSTTKVDASEVVPSIIRGASGTGLNAKIDNSGANPKLSNLGANFTSFANDTTGNGIIQYFVYAVNDGAYDAYLKSIKISNVTGYDKPIVCLPSEGTSKTLVDNACKSLAVSVYMEGANANGGTYYRGVAATVEGVKHGTTYPYNATEGNFTGITGFKLTKLNQDTYSSQKIWVTIGVDYNSKKEADAIAVDGSYSVKIGDITLEYSTQD